MLLNSLLRRFRDKINKKGRSSFKNPIKWGGPYQGLLVILWLIAIFKKINLNFRATRIRATAAEGKSVSRRVLFSFHTLSYRKKKAGHTYSILSYVGLKYSALCSNFALGLWSSEAFFWPDNTMDLYRLVQ